MAVQEQSATIRPHSGLKILVVNLHSSYNAGDSVLTRETVRQLLESFVEPSITLAMNDPGSYTGVGETVGSFMTWLETRGNKHSTLRYLKVPILVIESLMAVTGYHVLGTRILRFMPKPHRALLRAYFEADLVISSAGNFLYSSGRFGFPLLVAVFTMTYAWLADKPLYMLPQTIGPITRQRESILIRWLASKIRLLFVREAISAAELNRNGAWHDGCHIVPDIAFSFPIARRELGERLLLENGVEPRRDRPLLGITLIDWGAQNRSFHKQKAYETAVAAAILMFVKRHGGKAILFSQVRGPTAKEDDRIPARRVKAQLNSLAEAVVIIENEAAPEVLKASYGLMDIFIGTRLHSNIFALTEGVPSITLQYQYKTRGVVQMLGLERWLIEIEHIDQQRLTELLFELWSVRDQIRAQIQETLPALIQRASQTASMIAADFGRLK